MQAVTDAFSVSATFKLHNKPVSALWEWTSVPQVQVSARALLPSTSVISFELGNGLAFTTFVNTVPVSATKTGGWVREARWQAPCTGQGRQKHGQLAQECLPGATATLPAAVNRFALVRKLSWDKSGVFNADAWDAWARK